MSLVGELAKTFLQSSKSISHHEQDAQMEEFGITDKVSFTLLYLFQRVELTYYKAVEKKIEPTCSHILNVLGKIVVYAAQYDLSMASYPLHTIGKLAKHAQENGLPGIGDIATCTLLEVGNMIVTQVDVTYGNLKDPFFSLTAQLDLIAKEMFRQNKGINFKILTQPFHDLKKIVTSEKVASHQDIPIILQDIDRVIGEYATLEQVMKTLPPIPEVEEEQQG